MHYEVRWFTHSLMAAVLAAAVAVPSTVLAQANPASRTPDHLVTPSALQQAAEGASHTRQQNVDSLNKFFSSPEAQKALESARMNPQEVKNAVSGLSDQDIAQLAQRANTAQSEFAAGDLSNRDLLLILVFIAALILIIVAVH